MSNIIDTYKSTPIANPTIVFGTDLNKATEAQLLDLVQQVDGKREKAEALLKKAPDSAKLKKGVEELKEVQAVVVKAYDAK